MTNERPMTAAEHNAQVEAERRAYHERRCRESEGYKRVYEYITGAFQRVREQVSQGLTMTQQTMQQCNADATGATIPCEGTAPMVDSLSSREYVASVLDFTGTRLAIPDFNEQNKENLNTLKGMMKSMDAKAIADHKAVIDELEYWRKLRGEIFMEMYRDHLSKNDSGKSEDDLLNKTKYLVNQLWQQDQDFISDKKVFHIPVK